MRTLLELVKLFIAYVTVYGTLVLPVPVLWAAAYHNGTWLVIVGAGIATIPLFFFGLYTSFRLSRWYLMNWANSELDTSL